MNLGQIISEIEDAVQDETYLSGTIQTMINEAVLTIATGDMIPGKYQLSPPLPNLYTAGDVLTVVDTGYLSLPTDYNRNVVMVVDSNGDVIPSEESFKKFMTTYADQESGNVFKYAINGDKLHYRGIPTASTTLTVHYYTDPDTLSDSTDTPSCIPSPLHRKLIVGYVCRELFNRIEDGIDGQKINTGYYANEYASGLVDLETAIGVDESPDYYDNQTDYC
jgi:hypothetical protein